MFKYSYGSSGAMYIKYIEIDKGLLSLYSADLNGSKCVYDNCIDIDVLDFAQALSVMPNCVGSLQSIDSVKQCVAKSSPCINVSEVVKDLLYVSRTNYINRGIKLFEYNIFVKQPSGRVVSYSFSLREFNKLLQSLESYINSLD